MVNNVFISEQPLNHGINNLFFFLENGKEVKFSLLLHCLECIGLYWLYLL